MVKICSNCSYSDVFFRLMLDAVNVYSILLDIKVISVTYDRNFIVDCKRYMQDSLYFIEILNTRSYLPLEQNLLLIFYTYQVVLLLDTILTAHQWIQTADTPWQT